MMKKEIKSLQDEIYYIYPDRQVKLCAGMTVSEEGRYAFSSPSGFDIPNISGKDKAVFMAAVKLAADERSICYPEDLGDETDSNLKKIMVKGRVVGVKTTYCGDFGKINQPLISFHFESHLQFNHAIKNAKKVLSMYESMNRNINNAASHVDKIEASLETLNTSLKTLKASNH